MNRINKSTWLLAFLLLALCLTAVRLLGQTNGTPITPQDEAIRTLLERYSAFKLFLIPIITVLIMGIRKWIPVIPDQLWPWISPFIGAILDYAAAKMGFWTSSPEAGAMMGGLAVWFSQLGKQTKEAFKQGLSKTVSGKSNER